MNTPLIFKLDIFILSNQILENEYVTLSEIPLKESVSLRLDEFTSIVQSKVDENNNTTEVYEIIKIDSDNISVYPLAKIDNYVLSWKNSIQSFKDILQTKKGQKILIQYINHENEDIEEEKNKEDYIDWDI